MIDLTKIEEASHGHGSFAVWREDHIDDLSVIKESNKDLRGHVIFIGTNASGKIPPWRNFHSVHQGGRDGWLADTIGRNPKLRGAYMTDFFKGDYSVKETGVEVNPEIIQKNLDILKSEIALFEEDKPILAAFGNKTSKLLTELGFKVECLPHYARIGITKEEFGQAIENLAKSL
jgi:hypothetical protein